jgi:beta-fructofuranosidase
VTGTHYLVGEGPRGPWRVAPGPFLDGGLPCRRYAARVLETGDGAPVLLGFADRPDGLHFQGYVTDPDPVEVTGEGLLRVARGD